MRTLTLKSKPLTAAQYITYHKTTRNRKACAWIEFREAAFRFTCYCIAATLLCIASGGLIQTLILLSK